MAGTETAAPPREVVAVVALHEGDVCLLRRSNAVGSDKGLWHCITGYVEPGHDPLAQGLVELHEEAGLQPGRLVGQSTLHLEGWIVHVVVLTVRSRAVSLNWENDAYCWSSPASTSDKRTVPWLDEVLGAVALAA